MQIKATDTTGYDLQASDGTLGTVSDLSFDDASWTVRWLVVETGNCSRVPVCGFSSRNTLQLAFLRGQTGCFR